MATKEQDYTIEEIEQIARATLLEHEEYLADLIDKGVETEEYQKIFITMVISRMAGAKWFTAEDLTIGINRAKYKIIAEEKENEKEDWQKEKEEDPESDISFEELDEFWKDL